MPTGPGHYICLVIPDSFDGCPGVICGRLRLWVESDHKEDTIRAVHGTFEGGWGWAPFFCCALSAETGEMHGPLGNS